jgi:hypothetical protein
MTVTKYLKSFMLVSLMVLSTFTLIGCGGGGGGGGDTSVIPDAPVVGGEYLLTVTGRADNGSGVPLEVTHASYRMGDADSGATFHTADIENYNSGNFTFQINTLYATDGDSIEICVYNDDDSIHLCGMWATDGSVDGNETLYFNAVADYVYNSLGTDTDNITQYNTTLDTIASDAYVVTDDLKEYSTADVIDTIITSLNMDDMYDTFVQSVYDLLEGQLNRIYGEGVMQPAFASLAVLPSAYDISTFVSSPQDAYSNYMDTITDGKYRAILNTVTVYDDDDLVVDQISTDIGNGDVTFYEALSNINSDNRCTQASQSEVVQWNYNEYLNLQGCAWNDANALQCIVQGAAQIIPATNLGLTQTQLDAIPVCAETYSNLEQRYIGKTVVFQ